MKLLVKNGLIVNADSSYHADVLCENDKIIRIAKKISKKEADQIVDAKGCYVFPGGIDPHVHMHLPSHAGFSADDFYSGSRSALFGGTTTIIDFVTPRKGQSLVEALSERKKEATDSLIDFSFHVSPVEWRDTTEKEIEECVNQGITSFKIYMAYKRAIGLEDDAIIKVMQAVSRQGGLVTSHCELGDEIDVLRQQFISEGKTSPEYHPLSRPPKLEALAVKHFINLAKNNHCPIYIVHVSAKDSLQYIKKSQSEEQVVFAETCPQYLLLDDRKYKGTFKQTSSFVMSPPLRKKDDNKALWKALSDGIIQTLGTDHCPFTYEQKSFGKDNFTKIPNGAGGVEHRLALLFTYGVLKNTISINEFVAVSSTNTAKIFGLYPRKGVIQEGSDADLVIWNPEVERIISTKTDHSKGNTNIFEDFKTKGVPEYVITKGTISIHKNQLLDDGKRGVFLRRKPNL